MRKIMIGVIGGSQVDKKTADLAFEVGSFIARRGAAVVCGGLGGVMESAARGASEQGGTVVGIIPSDNPGDANPFIDIVIPTGMGLNRNVLVVRSSDVLIAFQGSYGTLSEIAFALNLGKTVVALPGGWDPRRAGPVESSLYKEAFDAAQAVGMALGSVRRE